MRFRDYFLGQPYQLRSPISVQAASARINQAAGSAFWPFSAKRIVGGVWLGHLRLSYRNSPIDYNAKPVLSGKISEGMGGSICNLRYRAPIWVYMFYIIWYFVLALFLIVLFILTLEQNITNGDKVLFGGMIFLFFIMPPIFHTTGTRNSEEELGHILQFLEEHAEAAP